MPLNDILRASGVGRIDLMSVDVEHQEWGDEGRRRGGGGQEEGRRRWEMTRSRGKAGLIAIQHGGEPANPSN